MNFNQGEDIEIVINVVDSSNNVVVLSSATSVVVGIFIKEIIISTYSTGVTCTDNENITSISGSTITLDIPRSITKTFPVGEVYAKVLVTENSMTDEYSIYIGTCNKGYLKDNKI